MANDPVVTSILKFGTVEYELKDAFARGKIEEIEAAISGSIVFIGITTTALTDGATTNPIVINGSNVTAKNGNLTIYNNAEFIFVALPNETAYWVACGDLSVLGTLAYKNSATGSFTPQGSVAAPTISVASAGSTTTVNSITNVGTLPELTTTYDSSTETLTIGFSQGTLPTKGSDTTVKTGDASYSASAPAFTGTAGTVTVS